MSPLDGFKQKMKNLYCPLATNGRLKTLHETFHLVIENTYQLAKSLFKRKGLIKTTSQIVKGCEVCQKNNPCNNQSALPDLQRAGRYPGEDWQIDFTHATSEETSVPTGLG